MISVCIATYNGEKYIYQQIKSILQQLAKEDEIIISDNGSTDRTLEIIYEFLDPRIQVYSLLQSNIEHRYSKKHYLVTKNFENALRYATGDYIFLSDQDDIWKNNKVEIMISSLQQYDLVISNFDIIDAQNNVLHNLFHHSKISKCLLCNVLRMPFWGCCMAFRKEILKNAMPFPTKLIMHDNWIGILATLIGKVGYINEALIYYRRHDSNVSAERGLSINPYWFKLYYRFQFVCVLIKRVRQLKING